MAFAPGGIFNDLFIGRNEQLMEAGVGGGRVRVGGHVSRSRIWERIRWRVGEWKEMVDLE